MKGGEYTPKVYLDPIHFCDRFAQTISGKDMLTLSMISRMIKEAVFGTGFIQLKGRDGRQYRLPDKLPAPQAIHDKLKAVRDSYMIAHSHVFLKNDAGGYQWDDVFKSNENHIWGCLKDSFVPRKDERGNPVCHDDGSPAMAHWVETEDGTFKLLRGKYFMNLPTNELQQLTLSPI